MKKIFTLLMIFTFVCISAKCFARHHSDIHHGYAISGKSGYTGRYTNKQAGGYTGETDAKLTTVLEAKKMGDDAYVRLKGKITSKIRDEKYLFRDATGTIEIEIDDDDWGGIYAGPKDTVIIEGEIDREWNSVTVDVDRIILAK